MLERDRAQDRSAGRQGGRRHRARAASGEPEAVILGFIPADQRKFSYNFVFGLALTVIKIAEKNGGRAYATGLYFTSKADRGPGRRSASSASRAFKEQVDPKGIMNPGKVLGSGLLGTALWRWPARSSR